MNLNRRQGQYFTGKWISKAANATAKPLRYSIVQPIKARPYTEGTPDMEMYKVTGKIKTSDYYVFRKGDLIELQDGVIVEIISVEAVHNEGKAHRCKTARIIEHYILSLEE